MKIGIWVELEGFVCNKGIKRDGNTEIAFEWSKDIQPYMFCVLYFRNDTALTFYSPISKIKTFSNQEVEHVIAIDAQNFS